MATGCCILG